MKTGYAIGRAVENTFLVRERDRRRWLDLGLVLLTVVPLGAALVGYAWVHLAVIEEGYRIARLEQRLETLVEEKRRAQVEVARLLDPSRLAALAPAHGLHPPAWEQVLFVAAPDTPDTPDSPDGLAKPSETPADEGAPANEEDAIDDADSVLLAAASRSASQRSRQDLRR